MTPHSTPFSCLLKYYILKVQSPTTILYQSTYTSPSRLEGSTRREYVRTGARAPEGGSLNASRLSLSAIVFMLSFLALASVSVSLADEVPPLKFIADQKPMSTWDDSAKPIRMNLSFKTPDGPVSAFDKTTMRAEPSGLYVELTTYPKKDLDWSLRLLLDTGSDISWVAGENCKGPRNTCDFKPLYQYPTSYLPENGMGKTQWNAQYQDRGASGTTMTVNMAIGTMGSKVMSIGLASWVNYQIRGIESGLFGLEAYTGPNRWPDDNGGFYSPLWVQFAKQANLPREFTIAVATNPNTRLPESAQLEIGGELDTIPPSNRDVKANVILQNDLIVRWNFKMKLELFVRGRGQIPVSDGAQFEAALDTGAEDIVFDANVVEKIHNAMNAKPIPDKPNRKEVDCKYRDNRSEFAWLVIYMDSANPGKMIAMSSTWWVRPWADHPGRCLSLLVPKASDVQIPALFGMPWFLWAGKTIFDARTPGTITVTPKEWLGAF